MRVHGRANQAPVLVVDDDAGFREFVVDLLAEAGFNVRAVATVQAALQSARELRPALVISDVVLPGQSGYELCRSLREESGEHMPILLVSGERTEALDSVVGLLLGADDYLTKPFDPEELLARVRRAIARASVSSAGRPSHDLRDLTPREYEVLGLLASGQSQKMIADALVISPKTAATHIQRILSKLGVHSRAEAVSLAYRSGLLDDWRGEVVDMRLSRSA